MSFSTNKLALTQEHFSIVEIDLPSFLGQTCNFDPVPFYTPLTCNETWDGTTFKTYYFATSNVPLTFGRPTSSAGMPAGIIDTGSNAVYPIIKSISENVTEIQPGKGLAIQGSARISLIDFVGDPGPVTETTEGTFFGKLAARNILNNRAARIKHFHVNEDHIYEEDDALTRYYIIDSLKSDGKGLWSLGLKDELSKLDKDKNQFPAPTGGTIRIAVNDAPSTVTIPVDSLTDWEQIPVPYTIKVGDELMNVTAVTGYTGLAGSTPTLTVSTRGTGITPTSTLLSTNTVDEHDVGDDVQICYTADEADIDRILQDIMYESGIIVGDYGTEEGTITLLVNDLVEVEAGHTAGGIIGNVYKSITATGSTNLETVDYSVGAAWEDLGIRLASIAAWKSEIADWHPSDKISTIWHDPTSTNDVVKQITNDFLLDIWFDSEDRLVKLSAISVWQETGPTIEQGKGINRDTFRVNPKETQRFSRAFIYHNKPDKVLNDDAKNYRNVSINIDSGLEADGFYGEPKTKEFKNSPILGDTAANLLTQRYTARFGMTPYEYSWITEERFLNFKTGDIATLITNERQNADGSTKEERAQILSVQPVVSLKNGRNYKIKALTFEPALADGAEFTINASRSNFNIFNLIGAPFGAVNVTLIIDGAIISSSGGTTIVAGAFTSGSTVKIIVKNSGEMAGLGGNGGVGGNSTLDFDDSFNVILTNGLGASGSDGGTVYDAQGIDTDIYLGGTIGTHTALGNMFAPGGGGGGQNGQGTTGPDAAIGGNGGGSGAGIFAGVLGAGGVATDYTGAPTVTQGTSGLSGDATSGGAAGGSGAGAGGALGVAGSAGDGAAGSAGKGIIKGGAVVNVYTAGNSGRFINGGGDTPDATT